MTRHAGWHVSRFPHASMQEGVRSPNLMPRQRNFTHGFRRKFRQPPDKIQTLDQLRSSDILQKNHGKIWKNFEIVMTGGEIDDRKEATKMVKKGRWHECGWVRSYKSPNCHMTDLVGGLLAIS